MQQMKQSLFFRCKAGRSSSPDNFVTASVTSNGKKNQPIKNSVLRYWGNFVRKNLRFLKKSSTVNLWLYTNQFTSTQFLKKYFVQRIMEQTTVKKLLFRNKTVWCQLAFSFGDLFRLFCKDDVLCFWCRENWAFNHITEQSASCCLALTEDHSLLALIMI